MKRLRDLPVLLVVAGVFVISLGLFRGAVGFMSLWFGVMVMLTCLGLVAVARPLFLLKLPCFLRKEREWEMKGRLYRALRVPAFGSLLRRTPLRYLNPMVYLTRFPDPSLVQAQIESAEASHVLAAAIVVPYMVHAYVQNWWGGLALLMVIQIVLNVYPILHLRWVRIRINRLQGRMLSGGSGAA